MKPALTRPSATLSPRERAERVRARGDAGFALAAVICILTAAAIVTAMMVPLRVMQSRREIEKELIFRGEEYVRAIQKYQRKYGVYPSTIDDLVSRDGFRFVRQKYKDPITGEDFRVISVNADGSLTGSLTLLSVPVSTQPNAPPGIMPPGASPTGPISNGGNSSGPATTTTSGRAGVSGQTTTPSLGGMTGFGGGMGFGGNSGMGSPTAGGATTGTSRAGVGGGGVGTGAGTGGGVLGGPVTPGTLGGGFGQITNPLGVGGTTQQNATGTGGAGTAALSGGTGGTAPQAGAPSAIPSTGFGTSGAPVSISPGIAGVASESTNTSVMVYNEKEKYNEWEFIAALVQTGPGAPGPNNTGGAGGRGGGRGTGGANTGNTFGEITPIGPGRNPIAPFNSGGGTSPFGGGANRGGAAPFGGGGRGGAGGFGPATTPFGPGGAGPRGAPPRQ
jgi:hypothetical protein